MSNDDDDGDDFQMDGSDSFRVKASGKDGNCLYKAISVPTFGSEENHAVIKRAILEFYRSTDVRRFDGWINNPISRANEIEPNGKWGGQVEIKVAATLLQKTIYLFRPQRQTTNYERQVYTPLFVAPRKWVPVLTPIVLICTTPTGTHFDALIPNPALAPVLPVPDKRSKRKNPALIPADAYVHHMHEQIIGERFGEDAKSADPPALRPISEEDVHEELEKHVPEAIQLYLIGHEEATDPCEKSRIKTKCMKVILIQKYLRDYENVERKERLRHTGPNLEPPSSSGNRSVGSSLVQYQRKSGSNAPVKEESESKGWLESKKRGCNDRTVGQSAKRAKSESSSEDSLVESPIISTTSKRNNPQLDGPDEYLHQVHQRLIGLGFGKNKLKLISPFSIEEKDEALENIKGVMVQYGGGYERSGASDFERSRINGKVADALLIEKCLQMHFRNLELEAEDVVSNLAEHDYCRLQGTNGNGTGITDGPGFPQVMTLGQESQGSPAGSQPPLDFNNSPIAEPTDEGLTLISSLAEAHGGNHHHGQGKVSRGRGGRGRGIGSRGRGGRGHGKKNPPSSMANLTSDTDNKKIHPIQDIDINLGPQESPVDPNVTDWTKLEPTWDIDIEIDEYLKIVENSFFVPDEKPQHDNRPPADQASENSSGPSPNHELTLDEIIAALSINSIQNGSTFLDDPLEPSTFTDTVSEEQWKQMLYEKDSD